MGNIRDRGGAGGGGVVNRSRILNKSFVLGSRK